jgi:sortase A
MEKTISIILACILCMALASPVFAYNYDFGSGPDSGDTFGKATSTNEPVSSNPMRQNVRRNKDAAYLPPPYFYGSGDSPTDPSSLYHDNTPSDAGNGGGGGGGSTDSCPGAGTPPALGFGASTSATPRNTEPKYDSDGSIGTIYVPRTGQTIKIYEGIQLDNLKKGAGHFASTSAWNGNVAMCGHNRGSWPYFAFVKDLKIRDKIIYTTPYGTRTYEVYNKEQISEYDRSKLGRTADNILTLITCIAGIPELRWVVQCKETR